VVQDARWLGRTRANFGKKGGADIRLSQQNGVVFVVHHSVIIKGIQFQLIQYRGWTGWTWWTCPAPALH